MIFKPVHQSIPVIVDYRLAAPDYVHIELGKWTNSLSTFIACLVCQVWLIPHFYKKHNESIFAVNMEL